MRDLPRRQRAAAACWVVIAVVVWFVLYDQMVAGRAIAEYLFRHAMWEAGRGPLVSIAQILDPAVYDAVWKSTLFASLILLAGLMTIRFVGR